MACTEVVRRRRIGGGEAHAAVEEALTNARTLLQKLALVLFDDAGRAGEVMNRINTQWGREAGDAVAWSNRGSHDPIPPAQIEELVDKTRVVCGRDPTLSVSWPRLGSSSRSRRLRR